MANYLKKSKIHELAKSMGYSVPALRECSYKFNHGSEWFTFPAEQDDEYYKFYVSSSYMSVEKVLDTVFQEKVIERKLYCGDKFKEILLKVS